MEQVVTFWRTTTGQAIVRATVLAGAAGLTTFIGIFFGDHNLQVSIDNSGGFIALLYWALKTVIDLSDPSVPNL